MDTHSSEEIITQAVIGPYQLMYKSDGILYIHVMNSVGPNIELLIKAVSLIGEMVGYKQVPMLATYDPFALPSEEARQFWARKDACPYLCAEAFVAPSTALQLIGKRYMNTEKPERNSRVFANEAEAIAWLKQFVAKG
ncbi:MAG: hypothetical protein ACHQRM_17225 [Bacteroidia bacterium]